MAIKILVGALVAFLVAGIGFYAAHHGFDVPCPLCSKQSPGETSTLPVCEGESCCTKAAKPTTDCSESLGACAGAAAAHQHKTPAFNCCSE